MSNGYHGKLLHVDLSAGRTWSEDLPALTYRQYLGGSALALRYLLRDVPAGCDPLGPDNCLVFTTSVVCGQPLSGLNRYTAAAKSPLTGGLGESEAGGYWGPAFKSTGFDGLVVHGRAQRPSYLFVHEGECEIRDASRYWGHLAEEVIDGLEAETGDRRICVLQTGIAGENRVLYAALSNQLRHFHGRTGLGAVMASKNLKAVVASGRDRPPQADRSSAGGVQSWFRETYQPERDRLHVLGTSGAIPALNKDGILPTYNFRDGWFEAADALSGQKMAETILARRGTCYACAVTCKREVSVPSRGVLPKYGGMDYEGIAALGSLCGVSDLEAVAEAYSWINRYVMDSISAGAVIAFAMECYEHGILTREDCDGIALTWGNAAAVVQMVHKIALRQGIGSLLADGVKRAAARLGRGSERFAMHVKGQELPMHEPRGKYGLGIAYAVSPTGADHMEAVQDPVYETFNAGNHDFSQLGLLEPVARLDLSERKVRAFFYMQQVWSLFNCIGLCTFVGVPYGELTLDRLQDYINAVTGWDLSLFEMLKVGERANTLARLFNLREGLTAADDRLPDRMFEPLAAGSRAGAAIPREEFARALQIYYRMAGWNERGEPTPAKLAELDLGSEGA